MRLELSVCYVGYANSSEERLVFNMNYQVPTSKYSCLLTKL